MSDSMEIQEAWNWQDWLDMVAGLLPRFCWSLSAMR